MLSVESAAKMIGMHRTTLCRLINAGVFTKIAKNPIAKRSEFMIREEEVEAFCRGDQRPSGLPMESTPVDDATQELAERHNIAVPQ
jgi:hypothetical protein